MIRILLFAIAFVFIGSTLSAQSDHKLSVEPELNHSMDEAFKEISKFLDTINTGELLGEGGLEGLLKGFSFDGKEMKELDGAMDSLGLSQFFGGDLSKLFEDSMKGMDMGELDKMIEEGMGMMQDIDMNELQKMFEGIDMSEMMKMFEGMDFQGVIPPQSPQQETPTDSKGKKLKKI